MKAANLSRSLLALALLMGRLFVFDPIESREIVEPAANGPVRVVRDLSELSDLIGGDQNDDEDRDQDQTRDDILDDSQRRRWRRPVGLATIWQETKWGRGRAAGPLGLREIQLGPAGRKRIDVNALEPFGIDFLNATKQIDRNYVDLERPKRTLNGGDKAHKLLYVVSPLSQLAHPIQSERLRQGYKNLIPLSGSYQTGLERVSENVLAPLTDSDDSLEGLGNACRTRRELVQLTRDETDQASGQLRRRCSGQIELNSCEGSCQSGVQPSVKSLTGLVKKCSCCNEATFRRIQVRLDECSSVQDAGGQLSPLGSFMDIELEEPIDCACRQCDRLI